ncbi:GerAB/ArcD/ProY family transporter [Bacillus sp. MRMR6]|uniref:GerAB/ArcD/ProY family transporter n=1 Tax=Bacillus sp. MRMR6 TaxID=1928617 RepID=UPI000952BDA2|nr:GerAB/ArcD/ProY family transporter [Bacillus sp. MRMR6]OLS35451.1 hypothetical protein BTR25_19860 [Bacillus sp. MRMR6]
MIQISKIQLFALIMIFEIGSTTLFALGIGAKQDAWIVVLLASFVGFFLLWFYTQIAKFYPKQNFSEILNTLLGKKLAAPLLFLFGLYFLSNASHNFYEFGHLIKITALPTTPLLVILYIFIISAIYILSLGFEVLARTAEILFPVFLIFLITTYIIILFSGNFHISELQPILGNGLSLILTELDFVIAFPFGEMVVFLMFWHFVDNQKLLRKTAFMAVMFSTVLVIFTLISVIAVIGPDLAANTEIPLLETILSINIGNIITNLDVIAVLIMFIGGFFKMSLHFYGFILALTWLLKAKNPKKVIFFSGLLFPLYVIYRFPGLDYKHWKGDLDMFGMLIFQSIPILLVIIMYIKRKKIPSSKEENNNEVHTNNL